MVRTNSYMKKELRVLYVIDQWNIFMSITRFDITNTTKSDVPTTAPQASD